jgi:hypothetical protein
VFRFRHLAKYDDGCEPVASGRFLRALMNSPLLARGAREPSHQFAQTSRGMGVPQLAKREQFDRLCARWLRGRASLETPDDDSDEVMNAKQDALDEAARQFLAMPAFLDWMIWKKWRFLSSTSPRTSWRASMPTIEPSWRWLPSRRT